MRQWRGWRYSFILLKGEKAEYYWYNDKQSDWSAMCSWGGETNNNIKNNKITGNVLSPCCFLFHLRSYATFLSLSSNRQNSYLYNRDTFQTVAHTSRSDVVWLSTLPVWGRRVWARAECPAGWSFDLQAAQWCVCTLDVAGSTPNSGGCTTSAGTAAPEKV